MKRLFIILTLFFVVNSYADEQVNQSAVVSIMEEDGAPDTYPWRVKFPNGSLTDNSDGTTSVAFSGFAPTNATYLTSTANSTLTSEIDLGALTTGLLKGTVAGGVSTISSVTDNSGNWNTAYGWGNHASAGYLTSLSGAVLTNQTSGQTIGDTTNRLTKLWVTDITCTNTITGSITGNAGTVTNGVYTSNNLSALSATTSAQLAGVLSDEVGTDKVVFNDSPTFADDFNLASAGVKLTGSNGSLTILGLGDGADEDLKLDLNTTANTCLITSPTSLLTKIDAGNIIFEGKFDSSDGTAGASATTGGLTFKDGLYTAGTISAGISNIVEDTTPQLGGALDCQEYNIDNLGDLLHDEATASDFLIQNQDQDKDIILNTNDGGSQEAVIQVDGATGIVTMAQQSGFYAYRATSDQTLTTGNWTKIQFNTEVYDTQGEFDNGANSKFTALKAGKYVFTSRVTISTAESGKRYDIKFNKNDTETIRMVSYSPVAAIFTIPPISACLDMAVGDYVDVSVYHDGAADCAAKLGVQFTSFEGVKVQ